MEFTGRIFLYFDPITDLCVGCHHPQTGEQCWLPNTSGKNQDQGEYYFPEYEPIYPLGLTAEALKPYAVVKPKDVA